MFKHQSRPDSVPFLSPSFGHALLLPWGQLACPMQYAHWVSACASDLFVSCGCLHSSASPCKSSVQLINLRSCPVSGGIPIVGLHQCAGPLATSPWKGIPLYLFPRQGCTLVSIACSPCFKRR